MRDHEDGLSSDQIERLRALEPEFIRRCDALLGFGIPSALEHGDLWRNNVHIVDGRAVFYDWTDGAIAFPLQSVPLMELQPDDWGEGAKDGLIEAYLEPWTPFAPMSRLREAFELVQPLIQLHRAATHPQYILPGVEDRREWLGGVTWMLQRTLELMNE